MSEITIKFLHELLIMIFAVMGAGIVMLAGILFAVLIVKIIDKAEKEREEADDEN
jgi:hypothetical protein